MSYRTFDGACDVSWKYNLDSKENISVAVRLEDGGPVLTGPGGNTSHRITLSRYTSTHTSK